MCQRQTSLNGMRNRQSLVFIYLFCCVRVIDTTAGGMLIGCDAISLCAEDILNREKEKQTPSNWAAGARIRICIRCGRNERVAQKARSTIHLLSFYSSIHCRTSASLQFRHYFVPFNIIAWRQIFVLIYLLYLIN